MRNYETELAWAAGFFDGEGSLCRCKTSGKSKNTLARIQVAQSGDDALEILERFGSAIGFKGHINGPLKCNYKDGATRKPAYQYHIWRQEDVRLAIERMWPYLSKAKKIKACEVLGI